MESRKLTGNVTIQWTGTPTNAMERAKERFYRDIEKTILKEGEHTDIIINISKELSESESYQIQIGNENIQIQAADELGVIYALIAISEQYLGIKPFWFWNDQIFEKKESVLLPMGIYPSQTAKVHYRGWFVNDEVLLDIWKADKDNEYVWEMVFEALLRLGGNMVIPGTDTNSKKNRNLASEMGLWITHHHAEPLGAEMFSRAYPDLTPSYAEHAELFHGLWREGIAAQKDKKIIWNLGFRGQGDRPFWDDDPQYDTPKKRGALISSLIRLQYEEVKKQVEHPICCTNLYGEVMELYQEGYIELPKEVIYIWADNGYGKMVSRRQGKTNKRVYALPEKKDGNKHGIYYHVSFYDLQAAGHMTMLPNSPAFVVSELSGVFEKGADEFWIVNCSNVKPHTYMLDLISGLWRHGCTDKSDTITKEYVKTYFSSHHEKIWQCFQQYHTCMLHYGKLEDERAGDQFYHYMVRVLAQGWLLGDITVPAQDAVWATKEEPLRKQIEWFEKCLLSGIDGLEIFFHNCEKLALELPKSDCRLFEDSIFLQAKIHYYSAKGALLFCEAFAYDMNQYYQQAFVKIGDAIECFRQVDAFMRACEHGKWKGFYENDCLVDAKFTAYCLESLRHMIRCHGDGPHFYQWAREYMYAGEDRKVMLITNMRNHPKDEELYQAMKRR